jgi:hypothetical protein
MPSWKPKNQLTRLGELPRSHRLTPIPRCPYRVDAAFRQRVAFSRSADQGLVAEGDGGAGGTRLGGWHRRGI